MDAPKLHSLWGVMPQDSPREPAPNVDAPAESALAPPAPKSLWDVMRGGAAVDDAAPDEPPASVEGNEAPAASAAEDVALHLAPPTAAPHFSSIREWWPVAVGAASIPLSVAACWPKLWLSLPSAACGFAALVWAVLVWLETKPSPQLKKLAAIAGALGLAGLLAGPAVFAPLGRYLRQSSSAAPHQPGSDAPPKRA